MPVQPGPGEAAAYAGNHAPGPHLDLLAAVGFKAAGTALQLGVFAALADGGRRADAGGPADAAELAHRVGADPTGVRLLADMLVSSGYLTVDDGVYANSDMTRRWLLGGPGSYVAAMTLWHELLFRLWDDLDSSIRSGTPAVDFYAWLADRPGTHEVFDSLLAGQAMFLRDDIVAQTGLGDDAVSLLDIGGGHARYTSAYLAAHPALTATIVDLPAALVEGRDAVAAAGIADRVTLRDGDWSTADLGVDHDAALLFNVVHGLGSDAAAALVAKAAAALRPGGALVLLDHTTDVPSTAADPDAATDVAFVRAFGLNLFHTQGGRVYSRAEMDSWVAAAGIEPGSWTPLAKLPSLLLSVSRKPG